MFTRHYDWVNLPYIVSGDLKVGPRQILQMINSDVGKEIQAKVEKVIGLKLVYIMPSNGGARAIATRTTRLVVPADIKNSKQRVSLAPLDMVINSQWGANPVPVPWGDTFTGFSQGAFEGVQIPIPHIHNVGFDEVAKYITMVNFQYLPQVFVGADGLLGQKYRPTSARSCWKSGRKRLSMRCASTRKRIRPSAMRSRSAARKLSI